jgi:hypothetical protein
MHRFELDRNQFVQIPAVMQRAVTIDVNLQSVI